MAASWMPPLPNGWSYTPQPVAPKAAPAPVGPALVTKRFDVKGTGDAQARQKVAALRKLVVLPALAAEGAHGIAWTRGLVKQILGAVPKKTVNGYEAAAMARRIFEWVKGRIRYTKDPSKKELFQQLPALLASGMGDCDDFTALIAALFASVGIEVKARIARLKPGQGWGHIYPVAKIAGKWTAYDGALPAKLGPKVGTPGFEVPAVERLDLEIA